MRKIDLEELKKIELEILDVIDKFCREHNINYGLCYGTLIGAIRHKGFIPWDDDIDIAMLRPDYDKFAELFNKYNTRYQFYCLENNKDYPLYHGRVIDTHTILRDDIRDTGIYVDFFCWDNAPDDDNALDKMLKRKKFFWRSYVRSSYPAVRLFGSRISLLAKIRSWSFRTLMHIISKCLPKNYFARKMEENAKTYAHVNTKRVGDFSGLYPTVVSKEAFSEYIDAEFEGRTYKIPIGYDEILTGLYGDYMTPPPEEKRKPRHHFEAYVKD